MFSLCSPKAGIDIIPLAIDSDAPLLAALGFPTPDMICRLWYHGAKWGPQYSNFVVEMLGMEEKLIPPGGLRSGRTMTYTSDDKQTVYVIDLWRLRVLDRDSPIIIREIYNPLTDDKAPLTHALTRLKWSTCICNINPAMTDPDKEVLNTQNVARGLKILREAAGGKLEEKREMMIEAVEIYVKEQTANGRRPGKWTFRQFAKHWMWGRTQSQNLYKELPEPLRKEAEAMYKKRCAEIIRARHGGESI